MKPLPNILEGHAAINYASRLGLRLNKHAVPHPDGCDDSQPLEAARWGISLDEAIAIARTDPGRIFVLESAGGRTDSIREGSALHSAVMGEDDDDPCECEMGVVPGDDGLECCDLCQRFHSDIEAREWAGKALRSLFSACDPSDTLRGAFERLGLDMEPAK